MQKLSVFISFLVLMYLPCIAHAEIKTITVTQSCKMGANDSRNEVLRICTIEAGNSALKQAAAYIATLDAAKHHRLSPKELKAYTAAALRVKISNQKWLDMTVTMTAATEIDTDYVEKIVSRIKSDASLQNQFIEQQREKEELEQELVVMQNKLKPAPFVEADDLRKERNTQIRKIAAIETKRMEIINEIIKKSLDAQKRITVKMTMKDVKSLLGESDAQTYENYSSQTFYVWYYGYTRIYFDGTNVAMIR
jgi:hypothetical protein